MSALAAGSRLLAQRAAALACALAVSGCLLEEHASQCSDPDTLATVRQVLSRPMDVAKVLLRGDRDMDRVFRAYSALINSAETEFSAIRTTAYDSAVGRSTCVAVMEVPLPQTLRGALNEGLKDAELQGLLALAGLPDGVKSIPVEVGYVVQPTDDGRHLHVQIVNGEEVLQALIFVAAAQAAFESEGVRQRSHAPQPLQRAPAVAGPTPVAARPLTVPERITASDDGALIEIAPKAGATRSNASREAMLSGYVALARDGAGYTLDLIGDDGHRYRLAELETGHRALADLARARAPVAVYGALAAGSAEMDAAAPLKIRRSANASAVAAPQPGAHRY